MAVSCAPEDLEEAAKCFVCIPEGKRLAVMIYLMAQIAGSSTDPEVLLENAECIACKIPQGKQLAVLISLACEIAGGT